MNHSGGGERSLAAPLKLPSGTTDNRNISSTLSGEVDQIWIWRLGDMGLKKIPAAFALKIAVPYFVGSLWWILFSDRVVEQISPDVATLSALQTYKGWFFITVSALLVYLISRHYLSQLSHSQQAIFERESALLRNEEGILILLSNLPGMAYRCSSDEDRQMSFVSDGCKSITGFEVGELVGENGIPWNKLIVAEDRETVTHKIRQAVRDHSAFHLEYRVKADLGRSKWVSEQGCAIQTTINGPTLLVGYIFEVPESSLHNSSGGWFEPSTASGKRASEEQSISQSSNLIGRSR